MARRRPAGRARPHERVVYALNKPAGVVSTARDPQGRPTVVSLVPADGAPVPGGPARHRHHRPDPAHQRRRARAPAHASELRGREDLPRGGRAGPPVRERGAPRAPRRGRARRRADRAGPGRRVSRPTRSSSRSTRAASARSSGCARHVGHPVQAARAGRFGPLALGDLPRGRWRKLSAPEVDALTAVDGLLEKRWIRSSSLTQVVVGQHARRPRLACSRTGS